jgi:glycosyltransferase involved in cell wall biosynthesis
MKHAARPGRWRVALVVIARDEAPRIARLLDSVAPWVDTTWVLDTGSRDDTAAIAAAHGAQVRHFAWIDDFAAARNAALDAAAADWHVVLDADEWLIDGGAALAALRHTAPAFVGSIGLLDRFDDGQPRTAHLRLSRVLPGSVRYAGRVHEQPQHTLPVRPLALTVGHDGYLPGRLAAKRGRNRRLLQRALEASPGDAYLWYQLGKDAAVYDEHAEAEAAFARAASAAEAPRAGWWLDLVARRLFTLKRLKRHAEGLVLAESQLAACGDSPDFCFALGDLLLDWAADEPQRAGELLPMIEQAWRRCLALGERPELPGAVAGRGSHLAAHNLALLLDGTGRGAEAAALRERHAPELAGSILPDRGLARPRAA